MTVEGHMLRCVAGDVAVDKREAAVDWVTATPDTTDKRHKKRPRHETPVAAVEQISHGRQQAYLIPGKSPLWLSVAPRCFASLQIQVQVNAIISRFVAATIA